METPSRLQSTQKSEPRIIPIGRALDSLVDYGEEVYKAADTLEKIDKYGNKYSDMYSKITGAIPLHPVNALDELATQFGDRGGGMVDDTDEDSPAMYMASEEGKQKLRDDKYDVHGILKYPDKLGLEKQEYQYGLEKVRASFTGTPVDRNAFPTLYEFVDKIDRKGDVLGYASNSMMGDEHYPAQVMIKKGQNPLQEGLAIVHETHHVNNDVPGHSFANELATLDNRTRKAMTNHNTMDQEYLGSNEEIASRLEELANLDRMMQVEKKPEFTQAINKIKNEIKPYLMNYLGAYPNDERVDLYLKEYK